MQNSGTQILQQVLGGSLNVQSIVSALASRLGIDQTKTNQLVSLVTPIVAAVLGKQGGGANGLASVLAGQGGLPQRNAAWWSGQRSRHERPFRRSWSNSGRNWRSRPRNRWRGCRSRKLHWRCRSTSRTHRRRSRGLRREKRQHFPNPDLAASDFARLGLVAMEKLQHWDRSAWSQSARAGCDCESDRFD